MDFSDICFTAEQHVNQTLAGDEYIVVIAVVTLLQMHIIF